MAAGSWAGAKKLRAPGSGRAAKSSAGGALRGGVAETAHGKTARAKLMRGASHVCDARCQCHGRLSRSPVWKQREYTCPPPDGKPVGGRSHSGTRTRRGV